MLSTKEFCVVILIVEFIGGVLGNGYIVLVNSIDWMQKRKLSSIDYILTSLALSRISLIVAMVLNGIIVVLYPEIYANHQVMTAIRSFWTLSNYSSMYFATCLNVMYFLKVANISHPLFLWLKRRIDRLVHWLLLGCFAISLLVSFMGAAVMSYHYSFHKSANITEMFTVSKRQYFEPLTLFNLFVMVPFVVSLVSFFLLMKSLGSHVKHMKLNATGYRDPNMEAHVRAMKTVTSFLFFLFIYCVFSFLVTFSYLVQERILVMLFGEVVCILYPLGHSLILIWGNNKLRQATIRMRPCRKVICVA